MPQTIPDPPKQPCWAHICPCYLTYWFVLEYIVSCFWGYSWESLNSFSHLEDRFEEGKWDNALFHTLSSVSMPRDMSIAPHEFLAVVIAHCMCQIMPLMVHFVFTAMCQDHRQCLQLCWAKASQKGSHDMGTWNCPCCRKEEDLSHADSSNWSYPKALGQIHVISWCAGLC